MAKTILMEKFHLTVLLPAGLSKTEYSTVLRMLHSKRFQTSLHNAVGNVFRSHSSLKSAKFRISR